MTIGEVIKDHGKRRTAKRTDINIRRDTKVRRLDKQDIPTEATTKVTASFDLEVLVLEGAEEDNGEEQDSARNLSTFFFPELFPA